MELRATQAPPGQLRSLVRPARPRLDPADVVVPEGYDADGTLFPRRGQPWLEMASVAILYQQPI
ncbi:MAG TPA: hypothetical protein VK464_26105 [Symbiobacteriaceae bacterium]|jgi:hypothetical protein|nr:hypothetical protein [Symbiobacteriaceae bacterium]